MTESEKDQLLTPFTGVNTFDLVVTADDAVLELNNCPACGSGHPFVVIPQKGMVPGFTFRNTTPFHQYVTSVLINGHEVELAGERRLLTPSSQLVLTQEELAAYVMKKAPEFGFVIVRMTMPYPHEIDQYELPARQAIVKYLEVVGDTSIRVAVMSVLDEIRRSVLDQRRGFGFEFATAEYTAAIKKAEQDVRGQLNQKIDDLLRNETSPIIIGVLSSARDRKIGSLPNFGDLLNLFGSKGKMDA